MYEEQIGITIITGFLGAGKTSLLNQIIKNETNFKFAVIENEFSELGIDAELISGIASGSIIELSNGCICCTRNTELQETLVLLIESKLIFDHIIIETTGIAEPDSIVQSIISNPELKQKFYIDGVICLINGEDFHNDIEINQAIKQISLADLVIINKIEKCKPEKLNDIEQYVLQINPLCKIIKTCFGDYSDNRIIFCKMFNYQSFEQAFGNINSKFSLDINPIENIQSISIELEGEFIPEKFRFWMEYFLLLNQNNIYRAKGIISFKGNSHKIIFQAVKAAFTIEEGDFWPSFSERTNKLIFIGKGLNQKESQKSLELLMHD